MEASALGLTTAGLPYLTYSQKGGKLIRTAVHVTGAAEAERRLLKFYIFMV